MRDAINRLPRSASGPTPRRPRMHSARIWQCRWGWRWRGSERGVRSDLLAPERQQVLRTRIAAAAAGLAITAAASLASVRLELPRRMADALASKVATFVTLPPAAPVAAP